MTVDEVVEAVDPCPGTSRVARLHAWQHGAHAVRCAAVEDGGCGRYGLRFAWWVPGVGHLCGRCHDADGCEWCRS